MNLEKCNEILMKWFNESYQYSFVQELHIIYLHVIELKAAFEKDLSPERPLIYVSAIEDSYRFRYICATEQFIKVQNYICNTYFGGIDAKFDKYFANIYGSKGEYKNLKYLRNEFAHINNFHDIDIMPIDLEKIISSFHIIAIFYDMFIVFLKRKKDNSLIYKIRY
ncbi:hypothetical protein [Lysinibacillus sphaericus]|uniref:hypothetical protein n=1 Tax=Lysinibacillus sphaericus TaxID=1421 RepID=UPI003D705371